jgi:hypothetical protein
MIRLAPCPGCADQTGDGRARLRQLHLLALLEHPDALPTEFALRLAGELLVLTDHRSAFRCEPVEESSS